MNTKAKVHLYLYIDGVEHPVWDGKQLTRLGRYFWENIVEDHVIRIKAVNLNDGFSQELEVSRFDPNAFLKIRHLRDYVAGTPA